MNIAVVESNRQDSDRLLRFLKEYEEKYFFDVSVCRFLSGEEFISSFGKVNYTVAFLDIFMGNLNGIETAK